ncbi:hypothetical protein MYSTI_07652 [Myxococcus stipitatus DSM 14675]|uniref:Lipoprotein n=1 Tax=Myxococcus stipitatus (strain DSM 14675 / JCM 12634 / Mx s8) TaxID=1278073 RepID=L7UQV8_MYXSD|nr:hypothetical protein [Myxococcus stipitatus]AGC48924.1 hypothetical protein MYSTI_07652 [Myxococcus stipitatus DSM 14675]
MPRFPSRALVMASLVGPMVSGCNAPNLNVRVVTLPNGQLQVDGPLAGPFDTLEDLAENSCKLLTSQPGASAMSASQAKHGFEYCALYYRTLEDQKYYLSYLSDIGGTRPNGEKFCAVPTAIHTLDRKTALLLGPSHNHPHNPEFSKGDLGKGRAEGWSPLGGVARVAEPGTQQVWERKLLLFYWDWRASVCRTFMYNYFSRVVSALRDGKWVPIGKAVGRDGDFQPFEGQHWIP